MKEPRLHTSQSDIMPMWVERMVVGDRRLIVQELASMLAFPKDLCIPFCMKTCWKFPPPGGFQWTLTDEHKDSHVAWCKVILTRDDDVDTAFIPPICVKFSILKTKQNLLNLLQLCPFIKTHLAVLVRQFFIDNNFKVVPHTPYFPDLAPFDFCPFQHQDSPVNSFF